MRDDTYITIRNGILLLILSVVNIAHPVLLFITVKCHHSPIASNNNNNNDHNTGTVILRLYFTTVGKIMKITNNNVLLSNSKQ